MLEIRLRKPIHCQECVQIASIICKFRAIKFRTFRLRYFTFYHIFPWHHYSKILLTFGSTNVILIENLHVGSVMGPVTASYLKSFSFISLSVSDPLTVLTLSYYLSMKCKILESQKIDRNLILLHSLIYQFSNSKPA